MLEWASVVLSAATLGCVFWNRTHTARCVHPLHQKLVELSAQFEAQLQVQEKLHQQWSVWMGQQQQEQHQARSTAQQQQILNFQLTQEQLSKGLKDMSQQLVLVLGQNATLFNQTLQRLTESTSLRLKEIGERVDVRLNEGFEKTTATFAKVIERLSMIDKAQQEITKLSSNVVSLQEVLIDTKARGCFGEVQLSALIRDMMPESKISFQYTLSNQKRADCVLFLPPPTGMLAIDAKFPLDSYRQMMDTSLSELEHQAIVHQFRLDIRKHIQDIAEKYIIPGETSEGAVMFIPSEAIFAEIHARHPSLITEAHQKRVWLVSPTTMMAIITTARAVLKDAATRKQVHLIQQHLVALAKDFDRFQTRMNQLARHIAQAHEDVSQVHQSSQKISSRFQRIEQVELEPVVELTVLEEIETN